MNKLNEVKKVIKIDIDKTVIKIDQIPKLSNNLLLGTE